MKRGENSRILGIRSLLDSRRSDIDAWCLAGETLEQMGEKLGVSYGTVRNYCLRNEIQYTQKRGWRFGSNMGSDHHSWKDGRHTTGVYVRVLCRDHPYASSNGTVAEHRLVMEKAIGRYLLLTEVVHHKDCNRQNNHVDNLELFASNAEHIHHELTGRKLSAEHVAKMSIVMKGRPGPTISAEKRAEMSAKMKGRVVSEETKRKMSEAKKLQKPLTLEQRMRRSAIMIEVHKSNPPWAKKAIAAMNAAVRQQAILRREQKVASNRQESETGVTLPL